MKQSNKVRGETLHSPFVALLKTTDKTLKELKISANERGQLQIHLYLGAQLLYAEAREKESGSRSRKLKLAFTARCYIAKQK